MLQKNKTLIYCLIVMLLWGSLFPAVKLGMKAYSIVTTGDILLFAGVRFVICGAIICVMALLSDRASYKSAAKYIFPIIAAGCFSIILHYYFTYSALTITDSAKTAILKQVGILFYVCFSALFFKDDKLTRYKLIGVILGFLGIVVINTNIDGISFNRGDAFIISASFCSVFSSIISKKVSAKVNPITVAGVSQLFGGIVLTGIGRSMGGGMAISLNSSSLIFVYICLASIVSYSIWFWVLKNGELSRMFIIKFAEPLFACLFGAVLLGEFKWQYVLSFLFIAGGIYISNKKAV